MFQSFFESIKYVGHLLPISFLRIFLGYFYFQQALRDWKIHVLGQSNISDMMIDIMNRTQMPVWYRLFITDYFVPNWKVYAFILVGVQLIIGVSYLIGYVVRPASVLAILFCLNYLLIMGSSQEYFFKLLIASHIILAWVGAGRCLGLDYYFYKRQRGIWW